MSYWIWDTSLNLGIEIIDSQHQHIAEFINQLYDAHLAKDDILVSQVLIGLMDYTITHFAFEEELIALAKYPLTNEHKNAHAAFTARIDNYRMQHEHGIQIARPLSSELKIWLTQHIKIEDKKYVPYVKRGFNKSWVEAALVRFFGK
jgi:hemerythrin